MSMKKQIELKTGKSDATGALRFLREEMKYGFNLSLFVRKCLIAEAASNGYDGPTSILDMHAATADEEPI